MTLVCGMDPGSGLVTLALRSYNFPWSRLVSIRVGCTTVIKSKFRFSKIEGQIFMLNVILVQELFSKLKMMIFTYWEINLKNPSLLYKVKNKVAIF